MSHKIATSPKTHYYSWYNPNNDWIFLTRLVNEYNIFYCLNHETIHQVLNNFINYITSVRLDNIDYLEASAMLLEYGF